jgi:hypothetical protein
MKDSILKQPKQIRCASAISRRAAPKLCVNPSPRKRGRGERRVPAAPAASRAKVKQHTSIVTTGPPASPGVPTRNGFNGFLRALPVTGLFCHRRRADMAKSKPGWADLASAKLDASVGASGPHDFAVRSARLRQRLRRAQLPVRRSFSEGGSAPFVDSPSHRSRETRPAISSRARRCCVHRIPLPTFVTIAIRSKGNETAGVLEVIWVRREANYFLERTGRPKSL